jgi:hypothetical protein
MVKCLVKCSAQVYGCAVCQCCGDERWFHVQNKDQDWMKDGPSRSRGNEWRSTRAIAAHKRKLRQLVCRLAVSAMLREEMIFVITFHFTHGSWWRSNDSV